MKREINTLLKGHCDCCPGHDQFPNETYKNRRSKKARARDKKKEHKLVRVMKKRELKKEVTIVEGKI